MTDEKTLHHMADDDEHKSRHPFAYGALAGAAVGIGVGLLVAPRKGSELRHEMSTQLVHMKDSCASGLNRAKGKASHWGHKGLHAYESTRTVVGKSAHETGRYLSDVASAVTMKSRRQTEPSAGLPEQSMKTAEHAAKAEHTAKVDVMASPAERARPSLAVKSS